MGGVSLRMITICALFTFGSIFSASLIFLEYNHILNAHQTAEPSSGENPVVSELKKQLILRDDLISRLQSSEELNKLQTKISQLEEQINKQHQLQEQLSSLESRLERVTKDAKGLQVAPTTTMQQECPKTLVANSSVPGWKQQLLTNWGAPVLAASIEEVQLQKKLFDDYAKVYKNIMDPNVPDTVQKKQYIVLTVSGSGLGNEVEAAISCLLLGILTNRALLIKNAVASYWVAAHPDIGSFTGDPASEYSSDRESYSFRGGVDNFDQEQPLPLFEKFSCSDFSKTFTRRVFDISSNQYFVPIIANNPNYKDMIKKTFGKDLFGPLYRFFMKPNPSVQHRLDGFKETLFKDTYVIGIHMRREYIRTRQHPLSTNVFFRCAQQMTPNIDGVKTKIFLATDHAPYREEAKAFFGDNMLAADGTQEMDMLLLGECDDIIGTTGSTYTEVAVARASKLPLKVSEVQLCFRDVTSQPCFFFYKKFLKTTCAANEDFYSPRLYENPIFLNQRNCYHNFQWGADHI